MVEMKELSPRSGAPSGPLRRLGKAEKAKAEKEKAKEKEKEKEKEKSKKKEKKKSKRRQSIVQTQRHKYLSVMIGPSHDVMPCKVSVLFPFLFFLFSFALTAYRCCR